MEREREREERKRRLVKKIIKTYWWEFLIFIFTHFFTRRVALVMHEE